MSDSTDMFGDDPTDNDPPWDTGEEDRASAAELEAAGQSSMFGDPAPTPAPVPVIPPAPPSAAAAAAPTPRNLTASSPASIVRRPSRP
jgi:DNA polymerase-3 subunit gamma/tau